MMMMMTRVDRAMEVYEEFLVDGFLPNRKVYHALVVGMLREEPKAYLAVIMRLLDDMRAFGIYPDIILVNTVITACGRSKNLALAFVCCVCVLWVGWCRCVCVCVCVLGWVRVLCVENRVFPFRRRLLCDFKSGSGAGRLMLG